MSLSEPAIKRLDHLGLVAAFCHEIGLPRMIDAILPKYAEHTVSHGEALLAMILNGLGFHSRTLHMCPDFFKHKPVERLIGAGIMAEHLNDDVLGRTLDALFDHGVSEIYQVIAEPVIDKLALKPDSIHLDITSFHVDGEYKLPDDDETKRIVLVKGYSGDHRPDLNQIVLQLICENQAGIPVYMQAMSGNTHDTKAFAETTKHHIGCLKAAQNSRYLIADAALYTQETLASLYQQNQKFITRVPVTIKEAKQHLLTVNTDQLQPVTEGYAGHWIESCYGGVPQRWLLVNSEAAMHREHQTFRKNTRISTEKELKQFEKLSKKSFSCGEDALQALRDFEAECQFIGIEAPKVQKIAVYKGRGRPAKGQQPDSMHYQLSASVYSHLEKVAYACLKVGMFILATNEMDDKALNMETLLANYKAQQKVERGFRFLKSPVFLTSAIYLKKPERIEALLMIMTCSLMVYAALEHKIRTGLKQNPPFYPDMKGKPTQSPTARWVFLTFEGISTFEFQEHRMVTGIQMYQNELLKILGQPYESFYS
ncbi:transposase [Xenorhabdus nematophila ATCC 19061]|uniref:Transposase n=2 Tax=Xenorhabdus nematophila TaxID=628 RepID=D3VBM4_XENNA|nr:IS1634 family transposase [Xenorhabdus nematophila]CBJ91863.1 transposase [Xenorhabdus nematophila ATCC 19061]CEK24680.1 transposase [Xenorhabdus nematophila AN6/1]